MLNRRVPGCVAGAQGFGFHHRGSTFEKLRLLGAGDIHLTSYRRAGEGRMRDTETEGKCLHSGPLTRAAASSSQWSIPAQRPLKTTVAAKMIVTLLPLHTFTATVAMPHRLRNSLAAAAGQGPSGRHR